MSADDEIEPYLAYRLDGDKMAFALWPLEDGSRALALFVSAELASRRLLREENPEVWRVVRPAKRDLMKVFEECWEAGILHAVLETDQADQHLIFDLLDVLQAEREPGS